MNYQITDFYTEGYEDAIAGLTYPARRKVGQNPQYRAGYEAGKATREARQKPAIALTDSNFISEGYAR